MAETLSLIALIVAVASYVGYRGLWDKRDLSEFTGTLERLEVVVSRIERVTSVVAADLVASRKHADAVADDLAEAKIAVESVASDLAESQGRADMVTGGHPGEAADAGAQSGKKS